MRRSSAVASVVVALLPCMLASLASGCADAAVGTYGGPRVALVNSPAPPRPDPAIRHHTHTDDSLELPDDVQIVEPAHPPAESEAERSLVHVHANGHVCSGVAITPKLVVTAHQCVAQNARGPVAGEGMRVEIATSTLTWTERGVSEVLVPACDWQTADVAVLVLTSPVDEVKTLPAGTAPGPGGSVRALGFGHCSGNKSTSDHAAPVVDVQSDALVMDVAMCKGDVGGPVFDDAGGGVVGIVSHQDDPDGSPRHTTTAMRLDAPLSRQLVAEAVQLSNGANVQSLAPISCDASTSL